MNEQLNEAILSLVSKAKQNGTANDALRYTQAALNLAHVYKVVNDKDAKL